MRPESSRIISAEPNELLAVKDHCHVGTFPRTNGTERLTGVVSSESAGARIVRCLEATLCAGPAPVCTTSQSAASAATSSQSANIYQQISANIKYLRCLEATLCARQATTTVCTTSQSHHRHQLQPAPHYQQISEDRFRLPYNYNCWWTKAHGNGHLGKHVPRQHMGHDVPPVKTLTSMH